MDIEEPVEIENEMNITKAVEILNKLKSKVTLVEADEKEYRLPFLMNIEQQAIETVLSELEKKDKIIDLMAKEIEDTRKAVIEEFCVNYEEYEPNVIEYFTNKVEKEGK